MKELQRILSYVRRAVDDYSMIEEGDKIAVGVSAGKDSLTMLEALAALRVFYPKKFTLVAITVDMGFEGADFSKIRDMCERLDVPYIIEKTEIAKIIFDVRKEKNPCSLCARMRRGVLYEAAKKAGCNRIALGHHFDDAVETLMLNLFFEGRIGCFSPVTYLSRTELYMIRPMLYVPEKDIRYYASKRGIPVIKSPCPADGNTEREEIKKLLKTLDKENKGLKYRIFGAMQRAELDGFKPSSNMGGTGDYD